MKLISEAQSMRRPVPAAKLLPALPDKPRVLLADDDRGIRDSLGKLLRNFGCQVTVAAHGGQVLELVLNDAYDLLVLDLNMPQMDGWEALDHLQNLRPRLPVMVITAQPNQRDYIRAGGARVLMEKPLDLPLFLQHVRELINEEPAEADHEPEASGRFQYVPPKAGEIDVARAMRGWGLNE